jgi:CheY-like chemotaxis protein
VDNRKPSQPVVLVVEDEWFVRAVIVDFLRANGCQVLEAATGEEAVSLIDGKDQQLDVLFTDIRLGGRLNGWDVAEIFRKHRPAMRVLYASGYSIEPPRHVSDSKFFNKSYRPEDILKGLQVLNIGMQRVFPHKSSKPH